jgi:Zn-dependent protease
MLSGTGLAFGWAKPVPVNVSRLRHPRNDSIWVSLAGPFTNGLLFAACALAFRFFLAHHLFISPTDTTIPLVYQILFEASLANMTLGFFNLLPIPPLDGSVLIERLLPARAQQRYFELRPVGMVIVFIFVLFAFRNPAIQDHVINGEYHLFNSVSGANL